MYPSSSTCCCCRCCRRAVKNHHPLANSAQIVKPLYQCGMSGLCTWRPRWQPGTQLQSTQCGLFVAPSDKQELHLEIDAGRGKGSSSGKPVRPVGKWSPSWQLWFDAFYSTVLKVENQRKTQNTSRNICSEKMRRRWIRRGVRETGPVWV